MDQKGSQELLNLVSSVKARLDSSMGHGQVEFPIPQFIVVGRQSVGKSRLIEALAGETFNFVCGSLGSRRPTILEFRNEPALQQSKWYVLENKQWNHYPLAKISEIIGQAHESLGANVSNDPVRVKVESAGCVDLGLVDLPGFRDFALDKSKQELADKIEAMVMKFMKDENNVMICVEQAGDAANLSTLAKCKQLDPKFKRTILVRNKLDKYYRDLSSENINPWLNGFGDLPEELEKFALSLPHWDGDNPPSPFTKMRQDASEEDVRTLQMKGASQKFLPKVGFNQFANFVERKIQELFAESLTPLLSKLKSMKGDVEVKRDSLKDEAQQIDERNILASTRSAGASFANAFQHIMEGVLSSECNLMTLGDELRAFGSYCDALGWSDFDRTPDPRFPNVDAYEEYLRNICKVPGLDSKLNGGAQFRRMLHEVEVFFRFATISEKISVRDVIQSRGASMTQVTWFDSIVKLLRLHAPEHMDKKVKYVGARLQWFFSMQKEPVLEFMTSLKGSPEEHMFSQLYFRQGHVIKRNETMKACIFQTYDAVLNRQKDQFVHQYQDFLKSMFQNPLTLLKASSQPPIRAEELLEDVCLPSWEETKERIPEEFDRRSVIKRKLEEKINSIPTDDARANDAVGGCTEMIAKTFSFVRRVTADQMELYAESFFLLPMMRRLEGDMNELNLQESDRLAYKARSDVLTKEFKQEATKSDDLTWCVDAIQKFKATAKLI